MSPLLEPAGGGGFPRPGRARHRSDRPQAQGLLWLLAFVALSPKGQSDNRATTVGSCAMRLGGRAPIPSACSARDGGDQASPFSMKQGPLLQG